MRYCLGIGCDSVMLLGGKVDEFRTETAKNGLDFCESRVGSAMLDKDEGLVRRIDVGTVKGMA